MIITSPELPNNSDINKEHLFLAGGISNCPDWQSEAIEILKNVKDLIIFNPRRKNFDISDTNVSKQQIKWEFDRLAESTIVLFWFPKETLCPITLFEYGKCLQKYFHLYSTILDKLYVGTHPEYARRFDIIEQTALEGKITVYDNLSEMCTKIVEDFNA